MKRHHDCSNSYKAKNVIGASYSSEVYLVYCCHDGEHGGTQTGMVLKVTTCIETPQVIPGLSCFWVEKLCACARLFGALRRDQDTPKDSRNKTALQQSQSLSGLGNNEYVGCFEII